MKLKTVCKQVLFTAMIAGTVMTFAACGGSSGGNDMENTFMTSKATYLDAIAWYANEDIMLVTREGDVYELYYKKDIFGTTDPGMKGEKTIIYTGTYTSAPSADGDTTHLDLSLEAPTRI